jgi:hypothetical protein
MSALRQTEALKTGDRCYFRFPARQAWHPGTVVHNGGSGYWRIRDEKGQEHGGLYIEHVRPVGANPWVAQS